MLVSSAAGLSVQAEIRVQMPVSMPAVAAVAAVGSVAKLNKEFAASLPRHGPVSLLVKPTASESFYIFF